MDNLLAAEPLLRERLLTSVTGIRSVRGARTLAEAGRHPPVSPSLFLVYEGAQRILGHGPNQAFDLHWLVVAAVRNPRAAEEGTQERHEAGALLMQICSALQGWEPDAEHGPLRMATPPEPLFHQGYGYYPLRFATRILIRGESP